MDYSTIIIKIAGAALLAWTLRSIYKHFANRKAKLAAASNSAPGSAAVPPIENKPSLSEQLLNNLLLYLWLAFMLIFSTGMIMNN
jgi:hypothetical protein